MKAAQFLYKGFPPPAPPPSPRPSLRSRRVSIKDENGPPIDLPLPDYEEHSDFLPALVTCASLRLSAARKSEYSSFLEKTKNRFLRNLSFVFSKFPDLNSLTNTASWHPTTWLELALSNLRRLEARNAYPRPLIPEIALERLPRCAADGAVF